MLYTVPDRVNRFVNIRHADFFKSGGGVGSKALQINIKGRGATFAHNAGGFKESILDRKGGKGEGLLGHDVVSQKVEAFVGAADEGFLWAKA